MKHFFPILPLNIEIQWKAEEEEAIKSGKRYKDVDQLISDALKETKY